MSDFQDELRNDDGYENIVMVEGEAKEVKEDVIIEGLKYAHKYILEIISVQEDLASMLDISKMDIHEVAQNAELDAFVKSDFNDKIDQIVKITDKVVRNESKSELTEAILSSANEKFPDVFITAQGRDHWLTSQEMAAESSTIISVRYEPREPLLEVF